MAPLEVDGIEGLAALLGREIGPSEWLTVDQARIDAFAEVSGDHQWIHVDSERAGRESPYGTTIAHGDLTLSLIDNFRRELIAVRGVEVAINYGWDRVRFPAPVPAGSRIRAVARLIALDELTERWWHTAVRFTVEVEGSTKPCCVADSLTRLRAAA